MSSPKAGPPKFVSLEIARFLAALAVALEHLSTTIPGLKLGPAPLTMPASAAVLFFFTLSGFVIQNAHHRDAGRPARLPHYIWRRFWRIFPLYWLSLLPMLAVLWPGCSTSYLVKIFTLYPFTGPIAELNPPAWTLRCELLFYLVFGLALLPYARRVVLPVWGLLLAAAWYHHLRGWGGPETLFPFLPEGISSHLLALNNIMFFAGLGAGWLFARWKPGRLTLWPLLGAQRPGPCLAAAARRLGHDLPGRYASALHRRRLRRGDFCPGRPGARRISAPAPTLGGLGNHVLPLVSAAFRRRLPVFRQLLLPPRLARLVPCPPHILCHAGLVPARQLACRLPVRRPAAAPRPPHFVNAPSSPPDSSRDGMA